MTNYLNHLNQLRRTNEGDDTADAPGYALHLVRIPVSVLPGKKTAQGYGAEITVTAEPMISSVLLPKIYRSLVTNDVVDLASATMLDLPAPTPEPNATDAKTPQAKDEGNPKVNPDKNKAVDKESAQYITSPIGVNSNHNWRASDYTKQLKNYEFTFCESEAGLSGPNKSRAATPAPREVFSEDMLGSLGRLRYGQSVATLSNQRVKSNLVLDLRKAAAVKAEKAYELLSAPENDELWDRAGDELLVEIRRQNQIRIREIRDDFVKRLYDICGGSFSPQEDTVFAMAWAIVYHATILNQQLMDDMEDIAVDRGADCHPGNFRWQFYRPQPMAEASALFGNYVRARWPVHVFAIDPMTDDQNVADTFSRRREMQLALSLAFTSGRIGAQNFTRFARRIELDMEAIALNRTQVGFSHGEDTFGWRFYPRIQSPPVESNARVFFRDLLVGGPSRNCDLNTMRLEPGVRECVALVIMPSFVPAVRFDSRTNWFKLSNPKQKEFDLKQDVELGTAITCLRDASASCQDEPCVRGTDLAVLMRSVNQLEHRLPLQTSLAQVPFELTESGHNLFNHGVTDLAPRLRGYYGEPGAKDKEVNVAVLGENFSVTETKVIAGNVLLANEGVTLLSREVILIKIPKEALADSGKIDVHVATPYGISNHMDVEIGSAPSAWTIAPQAATCTYDVDSTKAETAAGYYKAVSYTPAIIAKFSGKLPTPLTSVSVVFNMDDLGPFTMGVRQLPNGSFTIDIKGLAQELLNALIVNSRIDSSVPPEATPYTLTIVGVSVNGGKPEKADGQLVLTFKRRPAAPSASQPLVPVLQQQQQQLKIQVPDKRQRRLMLEKMRQQQAPEAPQPDEPKPSEVLPKSSTVPQLEAPGEPQVLVEPQSQQE